MQKVKKIGVQPKHAAICLFQFFGFLFNVFSSCVWLEVRAVRSLPLARAILSGNIVGRLGLHACFGFCLTRAAGRARVLVSAHRHLTIANARERERYFRTYTGDRFGQSRWCSQPCRCKKGMCRICVAFELLLVQRLPLVDCSTVLWMACQNGNICRGWRQGAALKFGSSGSTRVASPTSVPERL